MNWTVIENTIEIRVALYGCNTARIQICKEGRVERETPHMSRLQAKAWVQGVKLGLDFVEHPFIITYPTGKP